MYDYAKIVNLATDRIPLPADQNQLTIHELERILIASKFIEQKPSNNSSKFEKESPAIINTDDSMLRFQFMELLVRLAKAKYIRTGEMKSYAKAMNELVYTFFNNFYVKEIESTWGSMSWREHSLFIEDSCNILQINLALLKTLYNKYSNNKDRKAMWAKSGEFILEDA